MTAEVVVLNRDAIAIAADSAVTLGHTEHKVYNSANKLFELSTTEPIGIMVHGGSNCGVIPWETVIKEYRRTLSTRTFPTVDDYAEDFIEYLDELVQYHPQEIQMVLAKHAVMFELEWVVGSLEQERKRRRDLRQVFQQEDQASHLNDCITTRSAMLVTQECLNPVDAGVAEHLVDFLFPDWDGTVRGYFRRFRDFSITAQQIEMLKTLVHSALRSVSMDGSASGLVFAGFGTRQIFPAWTSWGVDALVDDKVRARHLQSFEVSPEDPVNIQAFAQDDMVDAFLNGVHPRYHRALEALVDTVLAAFVDELRSAIDTAELTDQLGDFMGRVEDARARTIKEFHVKLADHLFVTHKKPILSVVSLLPKEELAEFAETLVSLTSFERRMTPSIESVGGPIDVAVISKGDGLVWIKRKHYFDKKFNLRYFERNRHRADDMSAEGDEP